MLYLEGTWQAVTPQSGDIPDLIVIYHQGTSIRAGEPPLENAPSWPRQIFTGTYSGQPKFKIKIDSFADGKPKDGEIEVKDANSLAINGSAFRRLSNATNTARAVKPPQRPSLADLRPGAGVQTGIVDLDGTWETLSGSSILDFTIVQISVTHQGDEITAKYTAPEEAIGHLTFRGSYSGERVFPARTETSQSVNVTIVDPDNFIVAGSARQSSFRRVSAPPVACTGANMQAVSTRGALLRADATAAAKQFSDSLCWASIAAEADDPMGQLIVGAYLRKGLGAPMDPDRAFAWITLSANNEFMLAEQVLAEMYLNAEGTQADPSKAQIWKSKARRDYQLLLQRERNLNYVGAWANAYARGHSETHIEMQRQIGPKGLWYDVPVKISEWVPAPIDPKEIHTAEIPMPAGFRAASYVMPRLFVELTGTWETTVDNKGRPVTISVRLRQEGEALSAYEPLNIYSTDAPHVFSGKYSGEEEKFILQLVSGSRANSNSEVEVIVEDSDHITIDGFRYTRIP